jgi:hypothetical protein
MGARARASQITPARAINAENGIRVTGRCIANDSTSASSNELGEVKYKRQTGQ